MKDNADAIFTWDYEKAHVRRCDKLYEKAKTAQWNGETDLPWETEVDQEAVVIANAAAAQGVHRHDLDHYIGSPVEKWGDKEWLEFGIESQNWTLSQFLHGEQGALLCTAKIVETVPWIDAKYYAVDAGDGRGPPRRGLRQVPRHEAHRALPDQRPPAHAARRHRQRQPLGHDLPRHADHGRGPRARRVRLHAPDDDRAAAQAAPALRDERRGAPRRLRRAQPEGVLRRAWTPSEIRERQEFAFEAAVRMRDRFLQQEVWERMGVAPKDDDPVHHAPTTTRGLFQQMLFSKIVPNCKKLGLLDAADGWLRHRFEELGVIQFEDWVDTGEEYGDVRACLRAPSRAREAPSSTGSSRAALVGSRRMAHQSDPHLLVCTCPSPQGLRHRRGHRAASPALPEPKVESQLIPMLEQGLGAVQGSPRALDADGRGQAGRRRPRRRAS